jgi:hypothetical protein
MHEVQGASDGVNLKKVIAVGVVSLVLFAAGIIWAVYLMYGQQERIRKLGPVNEPAEIYKPEIGIVDNILFSRDARLRAFREERAAWLNGYGWTNRKAGLIHIPIERAMADVVKEASMPEAAPPLPPPPPPAATPEPPKPAAKAAHGKAAAKAGAAPNQAEKGAPP